MDENDQNGPKYFHPDPETGIIRLPSGAELRPTSVEDLLQAARDACGKMKASNPHRRLINDLGCALQQLMNRLEQYENPQGGIQ